ncbi:MAG: hypothetical protein GY866_09410, partial [Proteobacteria bacterium]|nr:hypothetical protein [Pseudomonadota bacterium]
MIETVLTRNCPKSATGLLKLSRGLYYIISSHINEKVAAKTISKLRSLLEVLPFTDKEIGEALNSNMKDFEDGIQYFIAVNNGLKTIITRNIGDYKNVDINVFLPSDYLNLEKIKEMIDQIP